MQYFFNMNILWVVWEIFVYAHTCVYVCARVHVCVCVWRWRESDISKTFVCAACGFSVSGTLSLFVWMFVVRALGSIEKGHSKTSLSLLLYGCRSRMTARRCWPSTPQRTWRPTRKKCFVTWPGWSRKETARWRWASGGTWWGQVFAAGSEVFSYRHDYTGRKSSL